MPQAVWTGELSFGMVNIPVKLYTAVRPKRVQFHQYEAGTGRRIRYRRVAEGPTPEEPFEPPAPESVTPDTWEPPEPITAGEAAESEEEAVPEREPHTRDSSADEPEVQWEQIVRGYELEPGRVVTVDADELDEVAPERSRVLEIEQFVDLDDIDPIHFEKSYYVIPQRDGVADRPYRLLFRAMEESGKVAIGRFVMRTKEYLVAVRPAEHVLMLQTLFYADEIRDPKEMWIPAIDEPSDRELELALQFLEAVGGEWQPDRHRDEHRERLLDLINSKAGEALEMPVVDQEPPPSPVIDLMETLMASVEAARRARDEQESETG